VSKPWNPGRQTVELRPSRIRREPVRLPTPVPPRSREQDMRNAVLGVALVTAAGVALVLGISEVTSNRPAVEAPSQAVFGQCHTAGGPDCVVDGDSFFLAGQPIEIAAINAPEIRGAACPAERTRGIEAAVKLAELLNQGGVTVTGSGGWQRVEAKGADVAAAMVAAGVARESTAPSRDWCAPTD
jgi:endonuclease YncB( thermonuclease family)